MCYIDRVARLRVTQHAVAETHWHSAESDTGYVQSMPSTTHEKADMAVVAAAYPGELYNTL